MSFSIGKILLFGDSLTEGSWDQNDGFNLSPALQHDYTRRLDVVVRGFSGYTTEHARVLLPAFLKEQPNTKLIIIFFGTNDMYKTPGLFVPIERYEENMRHMVEYCTSSYIKVIVVGPTIVDETCDPTKPFRNTLLKLEYAKVAERVAKDYNAGFLDLYHEFLYALDWKEGDPLPGKKGVESPLTPLLHKLLTDGTHFTGEGYRVFYNALTKAIANYYPELMPENIPRKFPHHGDINMDDIRKSLGLELTTN